MPVLDRPPLLGIEPFEVGGVAIGSVHGRRRGAALGPGAREIPAVAKTSTGDFRLAPVPDIAFAQAGRDTALGGAACSAPPLDIDVG